MAVVNPYKKGLNRIVMLYVDEFRRKKETVQSLLTSCSSVRMVLCEAYEVNKKHGECEDLTTLSQEEKAELWKEARKWTGSNDRKILHDTCKAIIVIGSKL